MANPSQSSPRLVFGPFELDPASGELDKQGTPIKLAKQPAQILEAMLHRPAEVITREELHQLLWRDQTFVDFEHGLNAAINKLRQALGDSADQPRYIETLPGRGYRFIGAVSYSLQRPVLEMVPAVSIEPEAAVVRTPPSAIPSTQWRTAVLSGLALVTVAGLFVVWRFARPHPSTSNS